MKVNGESFNFGPQSINNKTVKELLLGLSSFWVKKTPFKIEKTDSQFHEAGLLQLNCDKSLYHLDTGILIYHLMNW